MFKQTKLLMIFLAFIISTTVYSKDSVKDTALSQQTETEFETQLLEPFGGKILKPKDWYYRERHGGPSYLWILSKENPDDGPYITGVKIQYIGGIQEGTGKKPEQFIRDFVETKKQQVDVLNECDQQAQDFFTRICLETLEPAAEHGKDKKFRIQYSLYWGNQMDMAIVMIQGTLEENWEQNNPIFKKMQDFEVIDMSRFEE